MSRRRPLEKLRSMVLAEREAASLIRTPLTPRQPFLVTGHIPGQPPIFLGRAASERMAWERAAKCLGVVQMTPKERLSEMLPHLELVRNETGIGQRFWVRTKFKVEHHWTHLADGSCAVQAWKNALDAYARMRIMQPHCISTTVVI